MNRHLEILRDDISPWVIWPVFMGGSIWGWFVWVEAGLNAPSGVLAMAIAQFVGLVLLEQWMPVQAEWNIFRDPETPHHIGHSLAGIFIDNFALISTLWVAGALAVVVPPVAGIWPTHASWAVQFVLALMIYELGSYTIHRSYHEVNLIWPLHAIHHALAHVHVVAGARVHFAATFFSDIATLAPLYFLGCPEEILIFAAAINRWSGNLAHANVRMAFPDWFVRWITTNRTHQLHHDIDLQFSMSNFGGSTLIFDQLFGTFAHPDRQDRITPGIPNNPLSRNFLEQLVAPFIWPLLEKRRCTGATHERVS